MCGAGKREKFLGGRVVIARHPLLRRPDPRNEADLKRGRATGNRSFKPLAVTAFRLLLDHVLGQGVTRCPHRTVGEND